METFLMEIKFYSGEVELDIPFTVYTVKFTH